LNLMHVANPFVTIGKNTKTIVADRGRVLEKLDEPINVTLLAREELA
jgi:hypothetical protein